jgi:hypothetical protein
MWASRIRRDGTDRGEIGLIGAFIALMIGAGLAGLEIAAGSPGKSAPPDVFVRINHASAVRTSSDGIQVEINYTAGVGPDPSGPAPWTTESKIYCIAAGGNGSGQWSSRDISTFIIPGTSRDGATTITFDYAAPSLTTVVVSCDVGREGKYFHSGAVDVAVPPSTLSGGGSSGTPSAGFDVGQYVGTYQVTFTTIVGIVLNCGPAVGNAVMDVSAVGGTRIKIDLATAALGGVSTSFETDLAPTAQFSGELSSLGFLTGKFEDRSGRMWVTAKAVSPDGHCTWSVEGPR